MKELIEINEFQGKYRFLSNFWLVEVEFEGLVYPSVEHAYQAAKTTHLLGREIIRSQSSPGKAKRVGREVPIRPDWEDVKLDIMEELVRDKFEHEGLRKELLATGNAKLVEGNWWHDTFWGVCDGEGQNHLGKILMKVRKELDNSL